MSVEKVMKQTRQEKITAAVEAEWANTVNNLPPLSGAQAHAHRAAMAGENIVLTGGPGTGKTTTMWHVIRDSAAMYGRDRVGRTSMNGVAALLIHGVTLHSKLSLPIVNEPMTPEQICKKRKDYSNPQIRELRMLIIDEISTVDGVMLDAIDLILKRVFRNDKWFGGLQIVLCGDFAQLPPVPPEGMRPDQVPYAFESNVWHRSRIRVFNLVVNQRQAGDPGLAHMCEAIRLGRIDDEARKVFNECRVPFKDRGIKLEDEAKIPHIHTHRKFVDDGNQRHINSLPGVEHVFIAADIVRRNAKIDSLTQARKEVTLKVGAVVMCIRNRPDNGLANGSCGTVLGFKPPSDVSMRNRYERVMNLGAKEGRTRYEWHAEKDGTDLTEMAPRVHVQFQNGVVDTFAFEIFADRSDDKFRYMRTQIALMVSYYMTIHKAQGSQYDAIIVHPSEVFASGHFAVAASRAKTRHGLFIDTNKPLDSLVNVDPRVKRFYAHLEGMPVEEVVERPPAKPVVPMIKRAKLMTPSEAAIGRRMQPEIVAKEFDSNDPYVKAMQARSHMRYRPVVAPAAAPAAAAPAAAPVGAPDSERIKSMLTRLQGVMRECKLCARQVLVLTKCPVVNKSHVSVIYGKN